MARRLLFEMPFTVEPPRLTNPELGLQRVTSRGESATQQSDLTFLDAPDHRLMRAGIVVSHRVSDGLGEWHLSAPGWQPWLPAEQTVAIDSSGDLPADLAELLRPLRRRAAIGPVAALHLARREFHLKGAEGQLLGDLRDDAVTVRRGGVTTSRFREVTLRPTPAMTRPQRQFLTEVLLAAGGIKVARFDDTLHRVGAPPSGLTDFPEPRHLDKHATLEAFVSSLLASRLQGLVHADLGLRQQLVAGLGGGTESASGVRPHVAFAPLRDELRALARTLRALSAFLEPSWRERFEDEVLALLVLPPDTDVTHLDGRYLGVLDELVTAVRAPQLGDAGGEARPLLKHQIDSGVGIVAERCQALRLSSSDEAWGAALLAARQMVALHEAGHVLFGGKAAKLGALLARLVAGLTAAQSTVATPSEDDLHGSTPQEAFEWGRNHQRSVASRDLARSAFLVEWPAIRAKLKALRGSA